MTTKNIPTVMNGCTELAKQFNVQDVTVRDFLGRVALITGVKISEKDWHGYTNEDENPKTVQAYYKWLEQTIGEDVLYKIESCAREFFFDLLNLYMMGFIPKVVLVQKFKPSTKMKNECGGITSLDWEAVLGDIEKFQATAKPVAKVKSATKTKKPVPTLEERLKDALGIIVKIGKHGTGKVRGITEVDTDMLTRWGKILAKHPDFKRQLRTYVYDDELYMVWVNKKKETLFSIDTSGMLSVADELV